MTQINPPAILVVIWQAQNDFHAGHAKNENVNNTNSQYGQDYKQGYKDGWSDAEFNINVIERSLVC